MQRHVQLNSDTGVREVHYTMICLPQVISVMFFSVVKLVQLSTNRRRQARLTGVNLSKLDENTVNTIFRLFASKCLSYVTQIDFMLTFNEQLFCSKCRS